MPDRFNETKANPSFADIALLISTVNEEPAATKPAFLIGTPPLWEDILLFYIVMRFPLKVITSTAGTAVESDKVRLLVSVLTVTLSPRTLV